jgi:hypothetical protein
MLAFVYVFDINIVCGFEYATYHVLSEHVSADFKYIKF